ncbi:RNA-binding protein [Clostridium sp. LBM24168]
MNNRGGDFTISKYVGRVVSSKAGRDRGKFFIIVGILDEDHVYISDGKLRTIENPKKKKLKHLNFVDLEFQNIRELLSEHQKVNNSMIKNFLQSYDKK